MSLSGQGGFVLTMISIKAATMVSLSNCALISDHCCSFRIGTHSDYDCQVSIDLDSFKVIRRLHHQSMFAHFK